MTNPLHQTFFQKLDIHARREFITEWEDCMLYDDACCKEVIEAMRKARLRKTKNNDTKLSNSNTHVVSGRV